MNRYNGNTIVTNRIVLSDMVRLYGNINLAEDFHSEEIDR